jgi:hypothetical protein
MISQNEPVCFVTDNLRPIPNRNGTEYMSIYSIEDLVKSLLSFAKQKPRVLIVSKKNGPTLFVGLSGELASVDLYPEASTHRSWFPKPKDSDSSEDIWITSEGEPSWFPAWSMMPVRNVIAMVAYMVEHDELPDSVEWMNLKGQRLVSLHEETGKRFEPRLMRPEEG